MERDTTGEPTTAHTSAHPTDRPTERVTERPGERPGERVVDHTAERPVTTHTTDRPVYDESLARDKFGGVNLGAACFGWLVAVGVTALLTGLLAVIATALDYSGNITQDDVQRAAGSVTLVIAAVLLLVLLIAYYAGGYVAGRMSRFDGGRQGVAVWFIGLLVTIAAAVLGWIAGDQYNLLDRVDLPRIPIPTDNVTVGGIITGVLVLVGTLLAAVLGGAVGRRYHDRVDRAAIV